MSGKCSVIKDQSHNCSILPLAQPSPVRLVVQRRNPILWEVKQMLQKNKLISTEQEHIIKIIYSNLRPQTPTSPHMGTQLASIPKKKALTHCHGYTELLIKQNSKSFRTGIAVGLACLRRAKRVDVHSSLSALTYSIYRAQTHRQDLTQEFVTQCKHAQKCPWLLAVLDCLKIPSREAITEGESHFSSSIYSAQFTLNLATAQS